MNIFEAQACSKQKRKTFYSITFDGEHKEAGRVGYYNTEKKEEDAHS